MLQRGLTIFPLDFVHSIEKASKIIAQKHITPHTIPEIVSNEYLLETVKDKTFVISAKDAIDSEGKLLGVNGVEWYRINRKDGTIIASTFDEINDLKPYNWKDILYISKEAAEIIRKTKEDGEERLLAFIVGGIYPSKFRTYSGMSVDSVIPKGHDAQVAGRVPPDVQFDCILVPKTGGTLEITLRDGRQMQIDAAKVRVVSKRE